VGHQTTNTSEEEEDEIPPINQNPLSSIRNSHAQIRENLDHLLIMDKEEDNFKVFNDIVKLLSQHDVSEEVVLYPTVKNLGMGHLADPAIEQTIYMQKLLHEMDKNYGKEIKDNNQFKEDVTKLRDAFINHTGLLEETEMLSLLESKLAAEDIHSINKWVDRIKSVAPTRPHPGGLHSAKGQLLTGPVLAFVDRFRDLSKKFSPKNPETLIN